MIWKLTDGAVHPGIAPRDCLGHPLPQAAPQETDAVELGKWKICEWSKEKGSAVGYTKTYTAPSTTLTSSTLVSLRAVVFGLFLAVRCLVTKFPSAVFFTGTLQ